MLIGLLVFTFPLWKQPFISGWTFVKKSATEALLTALDEGSDTDSTEIKTALEIPESQLFSIANIEIGESRGKVEDTYGSAVRETLNEYNVSWSTYHQNYQEFFLAAYDENNVVRGLYTNQDLLASQTQLKLGSTKAEVRAELGEPETAIRKGLFNYLISSEGEYDVFHLDNNFVTFFYDLYDEEKVTAVQIIEEQLEINKNQLYTSSSAELISGFEWQLFDLTNATRVKHGLSILDWSEQAQHTAQKHSEDMATNNFFDHTNLNGQSPFDRMAEDGITYVLAAENLAYGQPSSIFAHQGLLNSSGHRKNILNGDFSKLGIGVRFNQEDQPFFTELFYLE